MFLIVISFEFPGNRNLPSHAINFILFIDRIKMILSIYDPFYCAIRTTIRIHSQKIKKFHFFVTSLNKKNVYVPISVHLTGWEIFRKLFDS
jgi:hypothetical protein